MEKGKQADQILTACLPQDLSHKGCFQTYERGHPRGGTFVFKSDFGVLKKRLQWTRQC